MAAAVVMGILRLRAEVITDRFPAALVDGDLSRESADRERCSLAGSPAGDDRGVKGSGFLILILFLIPLRVINDARGLRVRIKD